VIVKVGDKVKAYQVGQRAGYKPIQDVCHACEYCKQGRETYCVAPVLTGLHIDGECYSTMSEVNATPSNDFWEGLAMICGPPLYVDGARQHTDLSSRIVQAICEVSRTIHDAHSRWCVRLCRRPGHVLGVDDLLVHQGIWLKSRTMGCVSW
jgi:hypothetical protein